MKRSSKIILAAIAATGLSLAAVSWVSAQGGWGGNCNHAGPMQGQGYGYGTMNQQGYGPTQGGYAMRGMHRGGYSNSMGAGCAAKGRHSHGGGKQSGGMSGNRGANSAARLEALKGQLQITAEQEPAWKAFEEVMQNKATMMMERQKMRGAMGSLTVEERVKMMRERAGRMTAMADAVSNLNATLNDNQKAMLGRIGGMGRLH
ncbi:MAG: Spy/CpxP family protein refolding chaperone [Sedimenticola sp.]